MIGRTLGHYRILEKLGEGGMGVVYRAHDEQLDRDVAIKVLPAASFSDPAARARLLREARSAAALNHPHISTIHEVGEAEGQAYIAMELVEGRTLSARLEEGGLPAEQLLRYGLQLAEALAHAHERGIAHRDFKSANVVITKEGRAKVLDFGLAKRLSEDELGEVTRSQGLVSTPGAIAGTLAYMAPEQLLGQAADARSDVWALGVVLYEMATGTRPFQGQTGFELSSAILNRPQAPLPGEIPLPLRGVIERCLEKEPEQRYPRGGEARAALEAIQTGAVAPWAGWSYGLKRRRWLALAAASVVVLLLVVVLMILRPRFGGAPRIESLAVLPLENLSGDPAQEYFADGMTEALITDLGRLTGLKRVIARGSVMRFKGTKRPLGEVARELHVDALITGAVLRAGDRVRITAQLINAQNEQQLWADRYERDLRDVLTLQSEVTRAIANEIKLKMAPAEKARLASARPVNPEAYDAYLKGRSYEIKLSRQGFENALQYYRLALEKDPNSALAYAGIGGNWLGRAHMGMMRPQEALAQARPAMMKAIELDDSLAEAHFHLGSLHLYLEWDWRAAEKEYKRAIELNPRYRGEGQGYADVLLLNGRRDEARADLRRGLELDPLNPLIQAAVGGRLLRIARYDEGIEQLRKAVRTEPNMALSHRYLWFAAHQQRKYEEALAEAKTFLGLAGHADVAEALARGYTEAGYRGGMRAAAEKLAARAKLTYVQPTHIAGFYAYAGDQERALEWLEKAYDARDTWMVFLKDDLRWESLRADPRFQALLRRMKFPMN